jgi:hypothetical protein
VESEYETVRAKEPLPESPWEGGAVPLRRAAEPDPEQEQRLRIIAAGARRRRALRRLALGASFAAALGMIAALGSRGSETTQVSGSLRTLVVRAEPKTATVARAGDTAHRGGGHHRRASEPVQDRGSEDARRAAALQFSADEALAAAEPGPPEPPAPSAPAAAPAPEPSGAPEAETEPSGAEAAEAEFGFEN